MLTNQPLRDWEVAACAIILSATTGVGIIAGFCFEWRHPLRWYSHAAAAGTAIAGLIFCQKDIKFTRRQKKLDRAEENCFDVTVAAAEQQYISQFQPQVNPNHGGIPPMDLAYLQSLAEAIPQPELEFYNLAEDLADEATGVLICGNPGSGKTSTSIELAGIFSKSKPHEVIVLDPHYNKTFKQKGLKTIGKIDRIEQAFKSLELELDRRYELREQELPDCHPMLIITDEVGACLKRFNDQKLVTRCMERFGAEGRKVGMTYIGILHSTNVSDTGNMSAAMRANYTTILLCKAAKHFVKYNWKDEEMAAARGWVKSHKGYPVIVLGGEELPAEHPTHAHHEVFKKNGNPPVFKHPVNPIPWQTIDEYGRLLKDAEQSPISEPIPKPNPPHTPTEFNLEKAPEPIDKKVSGFEVLANNIIEWTIKRGGEITLRDLKRAGLSWLKDYPDEILLSAFSALQENGLAEYIVEQKKGGTFSHILRVKTP